MSDAPEPYVTLARRLHADGIRCAMQSPVQMTVSRQVGPIWPNQGNSFWVTYADGEWQLFPWFSDRGYRVPQDIDMYEVCRDCMAIGTAAMHAVPDEIVQRFQLTEVSGENAE